MKTILLKFAGPLQSWGTSSHFETRQTDFYPSKSAVIGVVAASLGYRRDDDEHIRRLNGLVVAVRVDQPGTLLRDYHTVKKYKNNGDFERTYVTNRYYLEDAIFIVALSHEDEDFINEIIAALQAPYFQPFMGRRALPFCADFMLSQTSYGVMESLQNLEWQAANWYMMRKKNQNMISLEVYRDSQFDEDKASHLRKDIVSSFSQKGRSFGYRYEVRDTIQVENPCYRPNTEHDIFSQVGD